MWDILKKPEIPASLRICAGTDGSVTLLLEVLTGKKVYVNTLDQKIIKANLDIVKLLEINKNDDVNKRTVILTADDIPYVFAESLSPIKRMPILVKKELMKADIPIGKILRNHKLETRRDIINIYVTKHEFFKNVWVISREYFIFYNNDILMWINEIFPIDYRWNL